MMKAAVVGVTLIDWRLYLAMPVVLAMVAVLDPIEALRYE